MWLTKTSEDIIPVLIEIEAPGKPWLIKTGRSAKLTQAQGQIAEWQRALDNGESRRQFADMYEFPAHWAMEHNLEQRFLLVYGRRAEFDQQPQRVRERRGLRKFFSRCHDVRSPSAPLRIQECDLRPLEGVSPNGRRRAPTFRLGPANARELGRLDGLSDAIRRNQQIGAERRRFLVARLPYWQKLGDASLRGESLGAYSSTDWE